MVTLVRAAEWHSLPNADNLPDGDLVWGMCYKIDPHYAREVKEYLDHREKDGYSCQSVDVYQIDARGEEIVRVPGVCPYTR